MDDYLVIAWCYAVRVVFVFLLFCLLLLLFVSGCFEMLAAMIIGDLVDFCFVLIVL